MSINPSLLKRSFQPILSIADDFVDHFYEVLLSEHSELRKLFSVESFSIQKMALAESLAFIVENIENTKKLEIYLKNMGMRHIEYGAKTEHLEWVGKALIGTLAYFYSDNWTQELQDTWMATYQLVSNLMKEGMMDGMMEEFEQVQVDDAVASRVVTSEFKDVSLSGRVDQLAFDILQTSMKRQAEGIATQVFSELKDTFLSQLIRDEVKKQASAWVGEILKAAIEAEAAKLMEDCSARNGRAA